MKTSKHLKIAGALQIVQSLGLLQFGLYVIPYILEIQEGSQTLDDSMLILAPLLFVGACQFWFGIALIRQKQWVKGVRGFLCCAPSLFPPVILGAYTIWVLVQANKKDVYNEN